MIEEIEAKMEAFEKNSSDYEKLFDPRVSGLFEGNVCHIEMNNNA